MKKTFKNIFQGGLGQLTIPVIAIALLVLFNLIRDPSFFSIGITHNNDGNAVLAGNLISIVNSASELAVLAMGCNRGKYICKGVKIRRIDFRTHGPCSISDGLCRSDAVRYI